MSDVLYAVGGAPVSDRVAEILLIQKGNLIHVILADLRPHHAAVRFCKKEGKPAGKSSQRLIDRAKAFLQLRAPGQLHAAAADLRIPEIISGHISKLRLV